MMLAAIETMLDRTPPAWMRKIEAAVLMGVFARAFEVEAPSTEDLNADDTLASFREFTAACMEAALADGVLAATYRSRLGADARELGRKVRAVVPVRQASAFRLVRFFYRGIGIELEGDALGGPLGGLRFGPCSFAQRYTPADCWFMSAFDEGFMCGMLGFEGELRFECRLTEGTTCCRAAFG